MIQMCHDLGVSWHRLVIGLLCYGPHDGGCIWAWPIIEYGRVALGQCAADEYKSQQSCTLNGYAIE